ncbi:MAG: cold-shock protein, partial [Planctomycetota bacterium]
MPTGVVARFDPRRGYGFVVPDDGGEDVFVHQNNIQMEGFRYLKPGEQVRYELEMGEKGYKAVDVALTSERTEEDAPFHEDSYDGGRYGDRGDRGDRGERGGRYDDRGDRGGRYNDRGGRYNDRGDR